MKNCAFYKNGQRWSLCHLAVEDVPESIVRLSFKIKIPSSFFLEGAKVDAASKEQTLPRRFKSTSQECVTQE